MGVPTERPRRFGAPNATMLVIPSVGTTETDNAQLAVCCSPSCPVHLTVLVPIGKAVPDAGMHSVVIGSMPPWGSGDAVLHLDRSAVE